MILYITYLETVLTKAGKTKQDNYEFDLENHFNQELRATDRIINSEPQDSEPTLVITKDDQEKVERVGGIDSKDISFFYDSEESCKIITKAGDELHIKEDAKYLLKCLAGQQ